jgi:hypothetical protein
MGHAESLGARVPTPRGIAKGSVWVLEREGGRLVSARYFRRRADEPARRSVPSSMTRFAVLDLGSTTFQLLVADADGMARSRPSCATGSC